MLPEAAGKLAKMTDKEVQQTVTLDSVHLQSCEVRSLTLSLSLRLRLSEAIPCRSGS